jgi:hypothetical protein
MKNEQNASAVLMVEPTTFAFDEQTAVTNAFQHHASQSQSVITKQALQEFQNAVAKLRQHNIDVIVFKDTDGIPKPNAVFPNNWITTWRDGSVYLYPMATPSRRVERTPAVIQLLDTRFQIRQAIDLSGTESKNQFLEGTGAIVFDHAAKIAYGCISSRCDKELLDRHARQLGYQAIGFHAIDGSGVPIYHTNMVLAVQSKTAIVSTNAITDRKERAMVLDALQRTHTVVDITFQQLDCFCANVLEIVNRDGRPYIVLSQNAYDHLTQKQRNVLEANATLLPLSLPTIEEVGGGSARCMLAELFLPRRS